MVRPKNLKCRSCNKVVEDDWIICPFCGEKINNDFKVKPIH